MERLMLVHNNRIKIAVLAVLLFAPLVICIGYVRWCGVDVPYWDDWAFVKFYAAVKQGQLGFWQILSVQHLDHRICVPFLLMIGLSDLTKMNMIAIMYFTVFLSSLTALLFVRVVWNVLASEGAAQQKTDALSRTMFLSIPLVWLTLSLKQWEVFTWAFMVQTVLLAFLSTLTFLILDNYGRNKLALPAAIVSGVLCSYTYLNGLLVWPLGLFLLVCKHRNNKQERKQLTASCITWCTTALVVLTCYFYNYERWPSSMSVGDIAFDPLKLVIYFLGCIANPLASEHASAVSIGVLLLLLITSFGYFLWKKQVAISTNHLICFAIFLFGFFTDAMIAVGRFGLGFHASMYSRYSPLCMLTIVGLYMLIVTAKFERQNHRFFICGVISCLIVMGVVGAYAEANIHGVSVRNARLVMANSLRSFHLQNLQSTMDLHPTGRALEYARFLQSRMLSVFSAPSAPPISPDVPDLNFYCRLEKINEIQIPQPPNVETVDVQPQNVKALHFRGCAFDMAAFRPAGSVSIVVDDANEIPMAYGLTRTDIEESFHSARLANTGFEGACNLEAVGAGTHSLSLKIVSPDRMHCHRTQVLVRLNIQ